MPAIDSIPLLLAADLWQVVFGIIVFVLYSIGQLVSARGQAKKPAKPRRPQAPEAQPPQAARPAPVAGQGNQEEALRREVEDFLRRAQGKPPKQEQPSRPQPERRPRKQPQSRPLVDQSEPSVLLVPIESEEPAISIRREGVAEHVASHITSKDMIEHAEHLGDDVGMADERLESRLQEKFDHQLGSLRQEDKPAAPEAKKLSPAEEVFELLSKPGGMRQVIVAQEILRRPEW